MTTIINYNLGNPKSIKNMLAYLGFDSIISSDPLVISSSDRLILPGVGHFQHGMEQLEKLGLVDILNKVVLEKKTCFAVTIGAFKNKYDQLNSTLSIIVVLSNVTFRVNNKEFGNICKCQHALIMYD